MCGLLDQDQHGHGVLDGAARHHQQFKRVVEASGIAAAGLDDGEQLFYVSAEERRRQDRLAGVHPVDVAFQRVDFAVMSDEAVRMGQWPGGEGIGGEALVDEAQRAHHLGIAQLGVEIADLGGQQQAFVDDGPCGKRGDVEKTLVFEIGGGNFRFHALADHVEFALKFVLRHALGAADEDLFDIRLGSARHAADGGALDGRIAPAQDLEAFLANDALDDAFRDEPLLALDREKNHADAVLACRREGET